MPPSPLSMESESALPISLPSPTLPLRSQCPWGLVCPAPGRQTLPARIDLSPARSQDSCRPVMNLTLIKVHVRSKVGGKNSYNLIRPDWKARGRCDMWARAGVAGLGRPRARTTREGPGRRKLSPEKGDLAQVYCLQTSTGPCYKANLLLTNTMKCYVTRGLN